MALPTKFEDLDQKELYRSALEDFAVEANATDSKKVLLAALLESGVSWNDYVKQHPEVAPPVVEPEAVNAPRHDPNPTGVVTADKVTTNRPKTREPERAAEGDLYLVKMNRENPYFEFRGYKFTNKNPFVVMDAENTNAILTLESGFAIATPAEAQEYYG